VLVIGAMLLVGSFALRPGDQTPKSQARDYATLDVCQLIPGEVIARALSGKLVRTRLTPDKSFSRCSYFIISPGGDEQKGYVVWIQPPEDFETLKKSNDNPITPLTGLGDGAYMFHDKGDGRFKINVLKRGDLMFEATADSAESARKMADAVAAVLWKRAR
jgi:hypothetical protein